MLPKPPFDCDLTLERELEEFEQLKPRLAAVWQVLMANENQPSTSVVVPSLTLDPDAPPRADDRELSLLATEWSCNSGQPATGRIEVVEVVETETTVELVVGAAPRDEEGVAYTCISNPPTPFTVELERELGDREIFDASVVPAQEITEPTGRSVSG